MRYETDGSRVTATVDQYRKAIAAFKARIDAFGASVDQFNLYTDALLYALMSGSPPPPEPDPSWPQEVQDAHRALFAPPPRKFRRYPF